MMEIIMIIQVNPVMQTVTTVMKIIHSKLMMKIEVKYKGQPEVEELVMHQNTYYIKVTIMRKWQTLHLPNLN